LFYDDEFGEIMPNRPKGHYAVQDDSRSPFWYKNRLLISD